MCVCDLLFPSVSLHTPLHIHSLPALAPGPEWIRGINQCLDRPVMTHQVCISLQLSWKTRVHDGTPYSQSSKLLQSLAMGLIILHIITASYSICRAGNSIGDQWLAYCVLEDFSHSLQWEKLQKCFLNKNTMCDFDSQRQEFLSHMKNKWNIFGFWTVNWRKQGISLSTLYGQND